MACSRFTPPRTFLSICLFFTLAGLAFAQSDRTSRAWNKPVEPFRVIGNIYYVGAADITSFLITTPQGLILLDGGYAETAPQIEKNIAQLGFKVSDVRILLNSHAHTDHAGGLAALKQATGARLFASAGDKPLLESGGHDDPQFANRMLFPSVQVDQVVKDGETVELGGVTLHAVLTPGHTPGCTTWTMKASDNSRQFDVVSNRQYDVVFLCSTSAPDPYRLVNNKDYPDIVSDYRHTFDRLGTLPCDVLLAPHGSMFHLKEKMAQFKARSYPNPFIDPPEYQKFLAASEQEFQRKLQEQVQSAPGGK